MRGIAEQIIARLSEKGRILQRRVQRQNREAPVSAKPHRDFFQINFVMSGVASVKPIRRDRD